MEKTTLKSKFEYLNTSVHTDIPRYGSVLQAAIVYGANASGKSNLVRALLEFFEIAQNSAKLGISQKYLLKPFLFSAQTRTELTFFEVSFFWKDFQYRYGLELDQEKIHSEWLYRSKGKKETLLFERKIDKKTQPNKLFSKERLPVRKNVTYLSEAGYRAQPYAMEIIEWFSRIPIFPELFLSNSSEKLEFYTGQFLSEFKGFDKTLISFIQNLDVGIQSIQVKRLESDPHEKEPYKYKINSSHQIFDSNKTIIGEQSLSFEDESSGTQRLFFFSGIILVALKLGYPVIIDEFDSQLHPNMAKALIQLFQSKITNPNGAQLIITTHDVTLLKSNIFRRDQVWFVEKDEQGATELYSLSDYSVRNDSSFDKDYLQGKYGAVPHLEKLRQTVISFLAKEE